MHGYHDGLPSAGDAHINVQFYKEKLCFNSSLDLL